MPPLLFGIFAAVTADDGKNLSCDVIRARRRSQVHKGLHTQLTRIPPPTSNCCAHEEHMKSWVQPLVMGWSKGSCFSAETVPPPTGGGTWNHQSEGGLPNRQLLAVTPGHSKWAEIQAVHPETFSSNVPAAPKFPANDRVCGTLFMSAHLAWRMQKAAQKESGDSPEKR
jgi:hypothetical protein